MSLPGRPWFRRRTTLGAAIALTSVATAGVLLGRPRAPRPLPEVPEGERTVVTNERLYNDEASVPPQCYTKTEGRHNPCYTCHQFYDRKKEDRLNQLDDGSIQGGYVFSEVGTTNHWTNLFVDREKWVDSIADEDILAYIDEDNYSGLAERLRAKNFRGFIPDLRDYADGAKAFDERGLARDGSGWVAFNYKPFPGTFWPTNGSTDDVLVRLPKAFREKGGRFDRDTYYVNLTLVELTVKNATSIPIWAIDEKAFGVDLDGDGALGTATRVAKRAHYVGDAEEVEVAFQQFPTGAELMHSVRYVGVDGDRVILPRRMKELRYLRKVNVLSRQKLEHRYANERKEKLREELPNFLSRGDEGFDNALGWFVQGFLEDYDGALRPQSHEEGLFCMGCHSSIGSTIDSTFSFARKVPGADGWKYLDLVGMKDAPTVSEPGGEILNYLKRAGGGSEFRANPEMRERWFRADGSVDEEKVRAADVYTLVAPSRRRALELNKAYTHIVRHQSFRLGRDATVSAPENVLREVDEKIPPLEWDKRHFGWDLRLAW